MKYIFLVLMMCTQSYAMEMDNSSTGKREDTKFKDLDLLKSSLVEQCDIPALQTQQNVQYIQHLYLKTGECCKRRDCFVERKTVGTDYPPQIILIIQDDDASIKYCDIVLDGLTEKFGKFLFWDVRTEFFWLRNHSGIVQLYGWGGREKDRSKGEVRPFVYFKFNEDFSKLIYRYLDSQVTSDIRDIVQSKNYLCFIDAGEDHICIYDCNTDRMVLKDVFVCLEDTLYSNHVKSLPYKNTTLFSTNTGVYIGNIVETKQNNERQCILHYLNVFLHVLIHEVLRKFTGTYDEFSMIREWISRSPGDGRFVLNNQEVTMLQTLFKRNLDEEKYKTYYDLFLVAANLCDNL